MAGTGISINDIAIPNDYYSVHLMLPTGESGAHKTYYSFQRDAPSEVEGLVRPRGGDFKLEDLRAEIVRAKAMGFDGFTPDIQSFNPADGAGRWTSTLKMMQAAADDGTFKIMPCPDMWVLSKPYDNALFADAIAELAGYSSVLRDASNRVILTLYLAAGLFSAGTGGAHYTDAWWQTTLTELHSRGVAVAIMPMTNGSGPSTALMDVYDGLTKTSSGLTSSTYGYAQWGSANTLQVSGAISGATTMRARPGNASKIWMHPVRFADQRPSASIMYEHEGTKLLRQSLADAATACTGANDFAQVITWNDYKEHSQVGPCRRRRPEYGLQTPGHIIKYYKPKIVSGSFAAITEDSVHLTHRKHLASKQLRLGAAISAGSPLTSLTVRAVPSTFRPLANSKLHTTLGEVITVAAQPATDATTLSINSWTPANAYAIDRPLIEPNWTHVPSSGNYEPMGNDKWLGNSGATDTVDTVEVLTYLTPGASATVTVTIGGVAQTPYTAAAGEHAQVFAAAVGAAPSVVVERDGRPLLTVTSPEAITAAPTSQDYMPVTATATSIPEPPETVSGLRIWLESWKITGATGGSPLTQWDDASGLSNHAAQATTTKQPTYQTNLINGLPAVRFDAGDGLAITNANALAMTNNASGITVVAVASLATVGAVTRQIFNISNGLLSSSSRVKFGQRATGSGVWAISGRRLDADAQQNLEGSATATGFKIITAVVDWANSNADLYVNGALVATTTAWFTDGNTSATNAVAAAVGARADVAAEFWDGDIAAVAVYNRALNSTERGTLESYYADTTGIPLA